VLERCLRLGGILTNGGCILCHGIMHIPGKLPKTKTKGNPLHVPKCWAPMFPTERAMCMYRAQYKGCLPYKGQFV
jgi:hypothetical protein